MSEKIIKDNPDVFMYMEPIGKRTYLSVLAGLLVAVIASVYLLTNWINGGAGLLMEITFIVLLLSIAFIFTLPAVGAKRMMNVKAAFSAWAVINYGLTPLEFLNVNLADARTDPTQFQKTSRVSEQKFLNSDAETVLATVTEDRSTEDIVHGEYARVTISNIRPLDDTGTSAGDTASVTGS